MNKVILIIVLIAILLIGCGDRKQEAVDLALKTIETEFPKITNVKVENVDIVKDWKETPSGKNDLAKVTISFDEESKHKKLVYWLTNLNDNGWFAQEYIWVLQ
ncbi:hypothetical protein LOZ80_39030 [Paenibacillus sp. HWE-109]|uniref:hypothetical protein n=1 Tax=Paenibacillus sp. HWE-109 TaxID=1306526 RepID=UPI001EDD431D|nr:hypothetical protein [Paenibacillus sp. HWE-109]UKS27361.1 hypothetical protein LOZ80_39030 [Paenibacillus sp. HWE-109]